MVPTRGKKILRIIKLYLSECKNANRFSVKGRFRGQKILFGQYTSNRSLWKVPTT